MADIKWIKLDVSIPDNRKIKRIRKLPDGNNIILFWVFLLARAGETNQRGALFFTDSVPYTEEDLAADFDFTVEFTRFAILTLEKYRMIDRYDDIIFIKNWDEYQQKDKLEKIQEQNRIRQANFRKKQQKLANSNVTVALPVTESNATELELELELEQDKEISPTASVDSDFDKLWALYPRKEGKKAALKKYKEVVKKGTATNKQIQDGIVAYKRHLKAENIEQRFIKQGGTYFNGECWNDEYETKMVQERGHLETMKGDDEDFAEYRRIQELAARNRAESD